MEGRERAERPERVVDLEEREARHARGVPRRTTAAPAPFASASARNACASKRSPFSATKSAPAGIARVSVETDGNDAGAPAGAGAPVARATSSAVKSGSVEAVARLLEDVVHDGGQALRPLEDLELAVGAGPALHDRVDVLDLVPRTELVDDVVHELEELLEEVLGTATSSFLPKSMSLPSIPKRAARYLFSLMSARE